ncbi:hypothetical protein EVAR_43534_1 [Eumeta japonica]|uniref:Uncharacterized protein n=1 Tax=Eumeta variegata TaxID=151549 RepID=A0A4C1W9X1_EUMVA|nr:hypothetical protein EVAR_43534_1 [Eumeta japonica]
MPESWVSSSPPSPKRRQQTIIGFRCRTQKMFKLRYSPYCACDPVKIQDVLCVFEDYDRFHREHVALETAMDVRRHFPEIMQNKTKREKFLKFCDMVVERCGKLNKNG